MNLRNFCSVKNPFLFSPCMCIARVLAESFSRSSSGQSKIPFHHVQLCIPCFTTHDSNGSFHGHRHHNAKCSRRLDALRRLESRTLQRNGISRVHRTRKQPNQSFCPKPRRHPRRILLPGKQLETTMLVATGSGSVCECFRSEVLAWA